MEIKNIKVVSCNARSLSCAENSFKHAQLIDYLNSFETLPEVVCIQETWNSEGKKLLKLPGYKPPFSFRREKGQQGGGVATFVKLGIDADEINYNHPNNNIELKITRLFGKQNLDIVLYTWQKTNQKRRLFRNSEPSRKKRNYCRGLQQKTHTVGARLLR